VVVSCGWHVFQLERRALSVSVSAHVDEIGVPNGSTGTYLGFGPKLAAQIGFRLSVEPTDTRDTENQIAAASRTLSTAEKWGPTAAATREAR
jgi:hypothetical protein